MRWSATVHWSLCLPLLTSGVEVPDLHNIMHIGYRPPTQLQQTTDGFSVASGSGGEPAHRRASMPARGTGKQRAGRGVHTQVDYG